MFFNKKEDYSGKKSMIIYFSRPFENYAVGYIDKGNTKVIAEDIKEILSENNDKVSIFEVKSKYGYAKEYDVCVEQAEERQRTHVAPIEEEIPDLTNYEVIYIGSPVYCGVMPEEMVVALKNIDFTGKIIRPFVTHEGSGLANIPSQLKSICKGANVLDGLAIRGSSVNSAKDRVRDWL